MIYLCDQGCSEDFGWRTPPRICKPHKRPWVYEKQMRGSSLSRSDKQGTSPKRRTMKRGRGFAASKEQREKVRGLPCAYCGADANDWYWIDPAHLWPRGKGGCDHPDCVIPLCRGTLQNCHQRFDEGKLELLPSLIDRGYFAEMAHPISAHEVSPNELVKRLTLDPTVRGEAG